MLPRFVVITWARARSAAQIDIAQRRREAVFDAGPSDDHDSPHAMTVRGQFETRHDLLKRRRAISPEGNDPIVHPPTTGHLGSKSDGVLLTGIHRLLDATFLSQLYPHRHSIDAKRMSTG